MFAKKVTKFLFKSLHDRLHNTIYLCSNFSNFSEESSNYSNPLNLFHAYGPGIYEIYCKKNGKRYIGEATNVLDRLAKHTRNLENGISDCSKLQLDWNNFGSSEFEAFVLFIGPQWIDREVRLKKETEIICSSLPEEVYNSHPGSVKENIMQYRVKCEIFCSVKKYLVK